MISHSTQSRYLTEKIRENKTILKDYKPSSYKNDMLNLSFF